MGTNLQIHRAWHTYMCALAYVGSCDFITVNDIPSIKIKSYNPNAKDTAPVLLPNARQEVDNREQQS